jgi:hypothetical protein
VSISHPLLDTPSQSFQDPVQANPQTPAAHVEVAFARLGQTVPHLEQFWADVPRLTSQPLEASLSQLPYPLLQETLQPPSEHVAVPFAWLQACPHPPQCATVFCVLVSQPLPGVASQLPQPLLQDPTAQLPVAHVLTAFGNEQVVPHAPQSVSVLRLVSHPFDGFPSQLA